DTRGWGSITGCNFRSAELQGSDFTSAWKTAPTEAGMIADARYDDATRWPKWLDPEASGAKRVETAMTLPPAQAEQSPPPRETMPRGPTAPARVAPANAPAPAPLIAVPAQLNGSA